MDPMTEDTCLSCEESAIDTPIKGVVSCSGKGFMEIVEDWFIRAPTFAYYKRKPDAA